MAGKPVWTIDQVGELTFGRYCSDYPIVQTIAHCPIVERIWGQKADGTTGSKGKRRKDLPVLAHGEGAPTNIGMGGGSSGLGNPR
jgi:hypothetical protein